MNPPNNPGEPREQRAIKELMALMARNEEFLNKARELLAEHYNGAVLLVQCFDPETQATCTRFITVGDPLAARQLAQKFLHEQQMIEEMSFRMRFQTPQ